MQKLYAILLVAISLAAMNATAQNGLTFHDHQAVTIDGDTVSLAQYQGKKVMVVNTASFCAYTPQFEDLQSLYEQYNSYNFEILGFPCNDFGSQDPHGDSIILDFCTSEYGVTFQMMHKVKITNSDTAPVYKWLQRADLNGVQDADVTWNFHKFLIDEAGQWVAHYPSTTNPFDQAIIDWILTPSVITTASPEPMETPNLISITTQNNLPVLLLSNVEQQIEINVYSIDGRLLRNLYNGTPKHLIDIPLNLPAGGVYLIEARSAQQRQTLKHVQH